MVILAHWLSSSFFVLQFLIEHIFFLSFQVLKTHTHTLGKQANIFKLNQSLGSCFLSLALIHGEACSIHFDFLQSINARFQKKRNEKTRKETPKNIKNANLIDWYEMYLARSVCMCDGFIRLFLMKLNTSIYKRPFLWNEKKRKERWIEICIESPFGLAQPTDCNIVNDWNN